MNFLETALNFEADLFENEDFLKTRSLFRSHHQATAIAKVILSDVMTFRRTTGTHSDCTNPLCFDCLAPHLSKVTSAIRANKPITFVLPAFPGKSPNPAKVLGTLPDMAERCALEFLQYICDRIKQHYAPGAHIILCSDGRVFSDTIGIDDKDVTEYQKEISKMISDLGLHSISTFNLEALYHDLSFDDMRTQLMTEFGESLDTFKEAVRRGKESDASLDDKEAHRLYLGMTRFLVEDSMVPGQTKSRSALQKESRIRAYTVIQRSKAWGELVSTYFPDAVRLSIHPQPCGSKKLGIRLIEPDNWQTPWHGVAVLVDGRFILLKRAQADDLGAHLVTRFGRPSHYVLADKEKLALLNGGAHEV